MNIRLIIFLLFAGTIIMVLLMRPGGNALKLPASPSGIISLEFASDSTSTQNIINAWDNDLHSGLDLPEQARKNIFLDFIFAIVYSSLLYALTIFKGAGSKRLSRLAGVLALAAGLCDIAENILMLKSLNAQISTLNSMMTFIFASIKFSMIAIVVLYIFWSIITGKKKSEAG